MLQLFRFRGWLALALICVLAASVAAAQTPAPKKGKKGKKKAAPAAQAVTSATQATAPVAPPEPTPDKSIPVADLIKAQQERIAKEPTPTVEGSLAKMRAATDWQLQHLWMYPANSNRNSDTDWVRGAFMAGVMANYKITTDYRYFLAAKAMAEKNNWGIVSGNPGRVRHADDQVIAQSYLEIYMLEGKKDPNQIKAIKDRIDQLMASPQGGWKKTGPVTEELDYWWCDALFMGPPTLARLAQATGDKKYLDYMDQLYWSADKFLYDKDEHFFFRDRTFMPPKLEKNGKKIFWGRGNGWVVAGICRILDVVPADYAGRKKYEDKLKDMAPAIKKAQDKDGLWHASMLDPDSYPLGETSGSGFFVYALAYGINNGLLDRAEYLPVVQKGWKALMSCVNADGKLCYVQPIGATPQIIYPENNMEYGTAAFCMAGGEIIKLMAGPIGKPITLSVANPIAIARPTETVEVTWKAFKAELPGATPARLRVADDDGKELVSQVIYGNDGPTGVIFQSDFKASETKTFKLTLTDEPLTSVPESKTYGRYVPERYDDFAWENDRIAHRIYGKALETWQQEPLTSSGIDVWVKSVRYSIINAWYKSDNYHKNNGTGLDFYTVGKTCGDGGMWIWSDTEGKPVTSANYLPEKVQVLANGPLRTTFRLGYAPWTVDGRTFSEVKQISTTAGSNLDTMTDFVTSDKPGPFKAAIGMAIQKPKASVAPEKLLEDKKSGIISLWNAADKTNGAIGTAACVDPASIAEFKNDKNQDMVIVNASTEKPLSYYSGACWSNGLDFKDPAAWEAYLAQFAQRVAEPLKVSVK